MRIVANSVPKGGTHLLDRLLVLLGFRLVDFGGIRPHLVEGGRFSTVRGRLKTSLGLRRPENVMGIGPHLVEGGRFPQVRGILRDRRPEKVTVGVDFPREMDRRWLGRRLSRVPDGCFVTAHCAYSPELASLFAEGDMRTVCIIRDPRDVAVSSMHYIKRQRRHFAHEAYTSLPSDHDRLLLSIRGGELAGHRLRSLEERYRQFSGWGRDPNTVMIKFEDLVGPEGGGAATVQRRTVERVAAHLDLGLDERGVVSVAENLFGVGRTFRRGQIGGWREEFSEEHEQAAREVAGTLLVELGYEEGPGWDS